MGRRPKVSEGLPGRSLSGAAAGPPYRRAMTSWGQDQISIANTFVVASFFAFIVGSTGVALAGLITVGLILATAGLRIAVAASAARRR